MNIMLRTFGIAYRMKIKSKVVYQPDSAFPPTTSLHKKVYSYYLQHHVAGDNMVILDYSSNTRMAIWYVKATLNDYVMYLQLRRSQSWDQSTDPERLKVYLLWQDGFEESYPIVELWKNDTEDKGEDYVSSYCEALKIFEEAQEV